MMCEALRGQFQGLQMDAPNLPQGRRELASFAVEASFVAPKTVWDGSFDFEDSVHCLH